MSSLPETHSKSQNRQNQENFPSAIGHCTSYLKSREIDFQSSRLRVEEVHLATEASSFDWGETLDQLT